MRRRRHHQRVRPAARLFAWGVPVPVRRPWSPDRAQPHVQPLVVCVHREAQLALLEDDRSAALPAQPDLGQLVGHERIGPHGRHEPGLVVATHLVPLAAGAEAWSDQAIQALDVQRVVGRDRLDVAAGQGVEPARTPDERRPARRQQSQGRVEGLLRPDHDRSVGAHSLDVAQVTHGLTKHVVGQQRAVALQIVQDLRGALPWVQPLLVEQIARGVRVAGPNCECRGEQQHKGSLGHGARRADAPIREPLEHCRNAHADEHGLRHLKRAGEGEHVWRAIEQQERQAQNPGDSQQGRLCQPTLPASSAGERLARLLCVRWGMW